MDQTDDSVPAFGTPPLRPVVLGDLRRAIALGWGDLRRAPVFALFFAGIYVLGGWIMYAITLATGQSYWLVFAAIGFPLIGPFAAVGFYDISRRLSQGAPLAWRSILSVILSQSRRQLPSICAVIIVVFLFWFFLAHMIFALFLGLSPMTNVSSSYAIFLTPNGMAMLGVGSLVGAGFAALLYMMTVLSLPLLLDRELDFVTAMIVSFQYVLAHPVIMLVWAGFIACVTLLSLVPGFLGLFVTLPVLGHASWHLYDLLTQEDGDV